MPQSAAQTATQENRSLSLRDVILADMKEYGLSKTQLKRIAAFLEIPEVAAAVKSLEGTAKTSPVNIHISLGTYHAAIRKIRQVLVSDAVPIDLKADNLVYYFNGLAKEAYKGITPDESYAEDRKKFAGIGGSKGIFENPRYLLEMAGAAGVIALIGYLFGNLGNLLERYIPTLAAEEQKIQPFLSKLAPMNGRKSCVAWISRM